MNSMGAIEAGLSTDSFAPRVTMPAGMAEAPGAIVGRTNESNNTSDSAPVRGVNFDVNLP